MFSLQEQERRLQLLAPVLVPENSPVHLRVRKLEVAILLYAFGKLKEAGFTGKSNSFLKRPFERPLSVSWEERGGSFTAEFDHRGAEYHCCLFSGDFGEEENKGVIKIQTNERGEIKEISLEGAVLESFYRPIPPVDFRRFSLSQSGKEWLACYSTKIGNSSGWGMPPGTSRPIILPPFLKFSSILETIAEKLLPPPFR